MIGTGSSGVQMIPIIAQPGRAPALSSSAPPISACRRATGRWRPSASAVTRPNIRHGAPPRLTRLSPSAAIAKPTRSALEVAEEERNTAYESKWQEGGSISYLYAYTDLLVNKESNDTASEFVRNKIRGMVKDKRTAELLAPKDHPIGTKRLCLDTNYYETYNRDNVTLVDVRSDPIQEITETGLRTAGGQTFELDAIVFATGFDAMTGALREIDIRTTDGAGAARALGGRAAHLSRPDGVGLPQHVRRHRPGQPGREDPDDRLDRAARRLDRRLPSAICASAGFDRIEASPQAELDWVEHVNKVADSTLYPLGQLLVHGRQYSRQATRVHALCRRLRPLQAALRRHRRQGL